MLQKFLVCADVVALLSTLRSVVGWHKARRDVSDRMNSAKLQVFFQTLGKISSSKR